LSEHEKSFASKPALGVGHYRDGSEPKYIILKGGLKTFSYFRQGDAKFTPQNINPYLCTHLIYAFGGLGKDDTIQPFDSYQDIEQGMHTFRQNYFNFIVL
jgi:hypothetical protein